MKWQKRGIVWAPAGDRPWARSHAVGPTPFRLSDDVIRVFVTCLDEQGRGRPGYVDVDAADPTRVIRASEHPLLDIGARGDFDDNGLMVMSVVEAEPGVLFMYYAGFELCTHIRYRIFTGLAISRDGGETFTRRGRTPVLDRSDGECHFRCGPFVLRDGGKFRMWYVGGSEWTDIDGKEMPVYDLRYAESGDGIEWPSTGTCVMPITGSDEHGFGRPWVVKSADDSYSLFYSIRRRSFGAYRLGYATSDDGLDWRRRDDEVGLDVSAAGFDSQAIMYSAVVNVGDRRYCFYNGNDFGRAGFAVAELARD